MDTFIEKIVARKKTKKDYVFIAGVLIVGLSAIFFILLFIKYLQQFIIPLIITDIYGMFYFIKSRNIEYEYIVTNNYLDIDKIIDKKKRKQLFALKCDSIDIIAKVNSKFYNDEIKSIKKMEFVVSSMDNNDNIYFICTNHKGSKILIFFEPDQRMLERLRKYIPRKVFV